MMKNERENKLKLAPNQNEDLNENGNENGNEKTKKENKKQLPLNLYSFKSIYRTSCCNC